MLPIISRFKKIASYTWVGVGAVTSDSWPVFRNLLRVDFVIAIVLLLFCLELVPTIPAGTEDWQTLQFAGRSDEPPTVEIVESMSVFPYGNPYNYWHHPEKKPQFWNYIQYTLSTHMQGIYYDISCLIYLPFKALGYPSFPAIPLIMRILAFLAGFLSLLFIYNLGKNIAGRAVGFFAAVVLLSEQLFPFLCMWIGPRSFEIMFSLLVIAFCAAFLKEKKWTFLVMLGLISGMFHTTKLGMLWMWPAILATLLIAMCAVRPVHKIKWLIKVCAQYTAGFIFGFSVSLPYAFLNRGYLDSLRDMFLVQNNVKTVGIYDWVRALWLEQGVFMSLAYALGIVSVIVFAFRSANERTRPLIIYTIASLSCILFFSCFGSLWINTYYLIFSLAVLALVFAASVRLLLERFASGRYGHAISVILFGFLCVIVMNARWVSSLKRIPECTYVVSPVEWNTRFSQQVIPLGSSLAMDRSGLIFIDTKKYPEQQLSGTMKYSDVWRITPEYLFMSPCLMQNTFYQTILASQEGKDQRSIFDTFPFSLRLYQDLGVANLALASSQKEDEYIKAALEPIKTPGFRPILFMRSESFYVPESMLGATIIPEHGFWGGLKQTLKAILPAKTYDDAKSFAHRYRNSMNVAELAKQASGNRAELVKGKDLSFIIYKVEQPGTPLGMPGPISSEYYDIYKPYYAFDHSPGVWQSFHSGKEVKDTAYLGFDFGAKQSFLPRKICIEWYSWETTPESLALEYAGDDLVWKKLFSFPVVRRMDEKSQLTSEVILPTTAMPQRLWRVRAENELSAGVHCVVREMTIE